MYEVELKVEAAHDPVRDRLDELGATRLGTVSQADTYYDAPHRHFAETDEALRIRRETTENGGTDVIVTYKGPLVDAASKTRREAETAVDDGEAMVDVLAGLGFEPAATVRKRRERFEYDGYAVTLDAVDGLGEFVEVETEVDADESRASNLGGEPEHGPAVDSARAGARGVMRDLGLDPDEQIRTSYLGLVLDEETSDDDSG